MQIGEACNQMRVKLDSVDADHKKLVLNALQAEITVTGQNVKLHLGVGTPNSLVLTTGQTSA